MKRKSITLTVTLGVICAICLTWRLVKREMVMDDFYNNEHRAEDMLMDPLILNADLVQNRVIEEISDPAMPNRRYALSFLGVVRSEKALPALRDILADTKEEDLFRGDALESIYQISRAEGTVLAGQHCSSQDFLGYIARGLLDGSHHPVERTLEQARVGHHD